MYIHLMCIGEQYDNAEKQVPSSDKDRHHGPLRLIDLKCSSFEMK